MSSELPPYLPEWEGAQAAVEQLDIPRLRADIQDLVDYVLAEDTTLLDSLPDEIESALVTPLSLLGRINSEDSDPVNLVVAARLVGRSIEGCLDGCPPELAAKLARLPR